MPSPSLLLPKPDVALLRHLGNQTFPGKDALRQKVLREAKKGSWFSTFPCDANPWASYRFYLNVVLPAQAVAWNGEKFREGNQFSRLLKLLAKPLRYPYALIALAELYRKNIGAGAGFRSTAAGLATELTVALRPELRTNEELYRFICQTAVQAGIAWPADCLDCGVSHETCAFMFASYWRSSALAHTIAYGMYCESINPKPIIT